ncbi:MAG: hypothetical protein LW710_08685 [Burkholderiales bacterium]|jgi:hypothetical protein|uniref:hypothetical protein n=1 Tax=Limnobacter sp. TaxID=2003368 RepID=UPI0039BC2A33|nr:hypothetical protein [Burkholderiales bacterium]
MTFADILADLNEWHFFQEFVYSKNTFRPASPQTEVELADNVLWLGNILFAFQLKEREATPNTTDAIERKWFEKKILDQATRQIRDTLRYLEENPTISLKNHRGHERQLELKSISQLHKLVVYLPSQQLPSDCLAKKYHESKTAGVIHIVPAHDYLGIVRTLLTPAELADYFDFREGLIEVWGAKVNEVPEPALVGQFLEGDSSKPPSLDFLAQLKALDHRADEWDMSGVISKFPDKVTTENEPTDYYPIVTELALLKRNELREFKARFQLSIDKSRADEFTRPYRIAIPRTDCGFVFIPLTKELFPHRRNALLNMTLAHKYDQRLSKCIGIAIGNHEQGWFNAEWCYANAPWAYDAEMDTLLAANNPFRAVKVGELPRYTYKHPPRS